MGIKTYIVPEAFACVRFDVIGACHAGIMWGRRNWPITYLRIPILSVRNQLKSAAFILDAAQDYVLLYRQPEDPSTRQKG